MQRRELFLEVGMEEVPASYIAPAVKQLSETLQESLKAARIEFGAVQTYGTPRRFGVVIHDIAESGHDETQEVSGPPVRIAFDADGNPKVPALKFAEKVGLPIEKLERKETPKGEYLTAQVVDKGVGSQAHLEVQIPLLLAGLSFPKTMRWGTEKTRFARPVHWLCALLGGHTLSFSFAGANSGNMSRGHRFLAPDEFVVEDFAQFSKESRARYVIIDPDERRQMILDGGHKLAASCNGTLIENPELVELNTYLSEYPKPLLAQFEEHYLELPDELLQKSMGHHIKCFAIADSDGALMPYFVAVAGLLSSDELKVITGNQRVLRARLEDARHFYDKDRRQPLADRVETLDRVTFQSKLGSYGDKVRRLGAQMQHLAQENGLAEVADDAKRAAFLSKADLVTDMVTEFTDLQGIIGRYYALHDGEPEAAAWAIQEHYLPQQQDDPVPPSSVGQLLALADRLDTLVGGFAVGLRPSGSTDPYGLRRQTVGLLRILKEKQLPGRLGEMLDGSIDALGDIISDKDTVKEDVLQYIRGRLLQMLLSDGWERDLVDAVCVTTLISRWSMPQLHALLEALRTSVQSGLLAGLAYSFKRADNILRAAVKKKILPAYPSLGGFYTQEESRIPTEHFQEDAEKALFAVYQNVQGKVHAQLEQNDFAAALETLLELRAPIDRLFDEVMVMAEDETLRDTRLALLRAIVPLAFVDFGGINTESLESA